MPSGIFMGIDPGTIKTGFGIVHCNESGVISHISHGTIVLEQKLSLEKRLAILAMDLQSLVKKYQPTIAAIENVFLCQNPRSALALGQARGVALAVLGINNVSSQSITPTAIKSVICGNGRAKKFQVAQIVAADLAIDEPQSEDASDALAAALACVRMFSSSF